MIFFKRKILFLSWFNWVLKSSCETAVLTIFDDRCITNTTSAIAPLYNLSAVPATKINEITSTGSEIFYPKNFAVQNIFQPFSNKNWVKKSSLQSGNNLITDRRWESLKTYFTKAGAYTALRLQQNTPIKIPFSVQVDLEAHILLCESYVPTFSRCYQFMLRKYDITFRECDKIDFRDDTLSRCQNSTQTYHQKVLAGNRWNHFKITINNQEAMLHNQQNYELSRNSIRNWFSPNYLLFLGPTANGLWKVHQFDYFYSEISDDDFLLMSKKINLNEERLCVALFVSMCSHCFMQIQFETANWFFGKKKRYKAYIYSQDGKWREEKLYLKIPKNEYYMSIKTFSRDSRYNFWAFADIIRTCHSGELRVLIPTLSTTKYQLIREDSVADSEMDIISSLKSRCKADEFGENCEKCSTAFRSTTCPNRRKYCQLLATSSSDLTQECYCYPRSNGSACAEPTIPNRVNFTWTKDNYLNIQWGHPKETNGLLTSFEIVVNEEHYSYTIKSQAEYQAVYNYQITDNLTFPNQYQVAIRAANSAGYSLFESKSEVFSPPPIPELSIEKGKEDNFYTAIWNNNFTPSDAFKRFIYVLITKCNKCNKILKPYYKEVVTHHEQDGVIEYYTKDIPSNWSIIKTDDLTTYKSSRYELDLGNDFTKVSVILIYKHGPYIRSNITSLSKNPWRGFDKYAWIVIVALIVIVLLILILLAVLWAKKKIHFFKWNPSTRLDVNAGHVTQSSEPEYANQEEIDMSEFRKSNSVICPGDPFFKTKQSRRIKISQFEKYVKNAFSSGELEKQHELIFQGPKHSADYGELAENAVKNRYQNLIAYDHSRVVLEKYDGQEYSDYINANYIDGYRHPKAYIATQGPKQNTIVDFWRMIWQENVKYIVVVANVEEEGKKKMEQYWPNVQESITFDDYTVTYLSSTVHVNFEHRQYILKYKKAAKPKTVIQLHFRVWPDHGVPLYPQSLVPFLQKINNIRSSDFPLVVHCSAGAGRTGTIILCDLCLRMAVSEKHIDVLSMLEHLRKARHNMVYNIVQYKLVHLVLINYLMGMPSNIIIDHQFPKIFREMCATVEKQLQYIKDCEWQEDIMKKVALVGMNAFPPIDPDKNRFASLIPETTARIYLSPYSSHPNSSYINAVRVDGFGEPGRFIATQFPMPNTVNDFWRLILERNISDVICLNEIPIGDKTFGAFFTTNRDSLLINVGRVSHCQTETSVAYDILNFEVLNSNEIYSNEVHKVRISQFHGWSPNELTPDYNGFISFVDYATKICAKPNPVLVTCYDGTTGCGLFIAMSFLIEKINAEQECDVCQAVRSIRTSRKEFISTKEQMEFLYISSVLYVENKFGQYSNMGKM